MYLLFILGSLFYTNPSGGSLTVTILQFRNNQGEVRVALYNKEEGFPKSPEKALKILTAPISNNKSTVVFESLPPGVYAVSVFHDENKNGKMESNFFGIPKEGIGASNDARGHMGPPHYKDAKFIFNGNAQTITINLVYL